MEWIGHGILGRRHEPSAQVIRQFNCKRRASANVGCDGLSSGTYEMYCRATAPDVLTGDAQLVTIECSVVLSCLIRPRRLARPRTSPFHGGNTGSNPVGDANHSLTISFF